MRVRYAVLPAVLTVGALAAPAGAQAATLTVNSPKACYGTNDGVSLSGAGYTPGGAVTLMQGQTTLLTGPTADAAGAFAGTAPAQPPKAAKEEVVPFSAVDQTNPAISAFTPPLRFSTLSLNGRKAGANGLIQRIRARGFTSGKKVLYAHVRRGKDSGRKIKDLRLGRLEGACRTLNVKKRFFTSGAKPGTYKLYFDTARLYGTKRRQQLSGTLTVFRIFKSSAGSARAGAASYSNAFGSSR